MHPKLRTKLALVAIASMFGAPALAQDTPQRAPQQTAEPEKKEPVRNTEEWDIHKRTKLAIEGYDPVAYFPEGGGKAKKGSKDFEYTHKGVVYRFVSQAHLDMFKKAPARYEPAHGGWCSWAMADEGDKVEVDPESFIVKDNRLFLFYDGFWGDTRKQWLKRDHEELAATADRAWKKISREDARKVKNPDERDKNGEKSGENDPG